MQQSSSATGAWPVVFGWFIGVAGGTLHAVVLVFGVNIAGTPKLIQGILLVLLGKKYKVNI
jgi:hypothetical protein